MTTPPDSAGAIAHIGQRSLATQARDAILKSIMQDKFDGGRIPPEIELAKMLGVSRTTVRSALQSLQEAGVLVRTRGRGTVVREHAQASTLALQRLVSFPTLLEESGREATMETDWRITSEVPAEAREVVGVQENRECYEWNILFFADKRPAITIQHIFPTDYVARPFPEGLDIPDWFTFAERYGRKPVDHAVVDIKAVNADDETAAGLELEEGSAILLLLETHYSIDDEALAFSRISVKQGLFSFGVLRANH